MNLNLKSKRAPGSGWEAFDVLQKKLIYTPAAISALCSFLYYLPWIIDPREALGFYIIAFFWFLGAWIIMLSHLVFGIINKIKNKGKFTLKEHFIAASVIFCSYVAVLIGAANGYMVTV